MTHTLPLPVHATTAVALFALGIFMVSVHTALLVLAAGRVQPSPRRPLLAPLLAGGYLATWFAIGLAVADTVHFPLAREELRLPLVLAAGILPLVAAMALLLTSRRLGALNAAMPSSWLIRAQTYRIAGFVFLYPFLYYGLIPAAFALPAALGDMLTGVLAPIVGRALDRRRPHAFAWAVAWNVFGILDLIVAPSAAIASGARIIEIYPLAIVALFIGPPLGILAHLYSLRNLVVTARRSGAPGVRIPGAARQPAVAVGDRLGA